MLTMNPIAGKTLRTEMVRSVSLVTNSTYSRTFGPTRVMSISAMATVHLVFPSDMTALTRVTAGIDFVDHGCARAIVSAP